MLCCCRSCGSKLFSCKTQPISALAKRCRSVLSSAVALPLDELPFNCNGMQRTRRCCSSALCLDSPFHRGSPRRHAFLMQCKSSLSCPFAFLLQCESAQSFAFTILCRAHPCYSYYAVALRVISKLCCRFVFLFIPSLCYCCSMHILSTQCLSSRCRAVAKQIYAILCHSFAHQFRSLLCCCRELLFSAPPGHCKKPRRSKPSHVVAYLRRSKPSQSSSFPRLAVAIPCIPTSWYRN